jgi:excinuclease ABC subunit C
MESFHKSKIIETELSKIPHQCGVYIYRDKNQKIIYIGKAVDLFKRVHQYFQNRENLPPKTRILVTQIYDIETIRTLSEFDALLLEANLIYKHQPKYNILAKDDKSPLYIILSLHEELPHILFVRKPRNPSYGMTKSGKDIYFGPFQSGKTARMIIHTVRHIIPFCIQKLRNGKPCFYTQLGLCNPCPSEISGIRDVSQKKKLTRVYRRNILKIKDILSGKSDKVMKQFLAEMKQFASQELFEQAALIRNQIIALEELLKTHYNPMFYIGADNQIEKLASVELESLISVFQKIFPDLSKIVRIECYDVSNLSGTNATGSMVVLKNGIPDTSEYRRFKIRDINTPNDFMMMAEIIKRRLRHKEWDKPDLIVVDGGKGQLASALSVLDELGMHIPIIGLAKRREEIICKAGTIFKSIRLPYTNGGLHLIERIRDEAHRFAIGYHRKLRKTF